MSAHGHGEPVWIGVLCRVYTGLLHLYPRVHRQRWGAEMRQAFRDRCSEAHRTGRGPGSVLFAELLPDLARSIGPEHFDAIWLEANPMKRLLYALVAAFIAVVCLHGQVTPAMDAIHGWNNRRLALANEHAWSAHMAALAEATTRQRRDASDDVTTAILYHEAAEGHGEQAGDVSMADAIGRNATAELQDRADAAFARALDADDRWALWLAVRACPARPATCKAEASLARLERIESDNGAVWVLDLAAAQAASDPARARKALERLAQASRFDTRNIQAARALLVAFDRLVVPAGLVYDEPSTKADPAARLAWLVAEDRGYLFSEYLELKPFSDYCRATDPAVHAERRTDCRAAGLLMVRRKDLYSGYFAWIRNADAGEAGAAREAFRIRSWRAWGYRQEQSIELTPQMWRASWLVAGSGFHLADMMQAPAQPPASFQLRPEQYDPWY